MLQVQQWSKWMNKGSASIPYFLLENYQQLGVTDQEMMLLIHLYAYSKEGITFPSIEQLQERMSSSMEEISKMLNKLHKEGFLAIDSNTNPDGLVGEQYSLEPLWEKVITHLSQAQDLANVSHSEAAATMEKPGWWPSEGTEKKPPSMEGEVYRRFEQEFGRPLSPIECETIGFWLDEDQYEPHLIFLALREAVISNKLSLRYIDRILFEWQKNGIKTIEEVREHSKKFRLQQPVKGKQESAQQPVEFTFYNWLEK